MNYVREKNIKREGGGVNPYTFEYLTIESYTNNNNIYWCSSYENTSFLLTIQWSTDKQNWTSVTPPPYTEENNRSIITTLNTGDKVYLKGNNNAYSIPSYLGSYSCYISSDEGFFYEVSGNIMSLIYGDNFVGKTSLTEPYTFSGLFYSFSWEGMGVSNAENLILPATDLTPYCYRSLLTNSSIETPPVLPATTLATGCYYSMFAYCSSLTTAPKLPATNLAPYCYYNMFNMTSLTEAPKLPATTLAEYCYSHMFGQIRSLRDSPILPASTLVTGCYDNMFWNSSFYTVTALFKTTPSLSCTNDWLDTVSTSPGTLYIDKDATWDISEIGAIPSGWSIKIYKPETEYLTFQSNVDSNNIGWRISSNSANAYSIQYSTDKQNWTSVTPTTTGSFITLNKGDRVYIKGNNTYYATSTSNYCKFYTGGSCKVYGNIMSLLYGDNFLGKEEFRSSDSYIFTGLFRNCSITDASSLCLPAKTLKSYCYAYMFSSCTNLTTAPDLPAKALVSHCYDSMFYYCSSLNYIKAMFTTKPSTTYLNSWVSGVANSGTFVKNSAATWTNTYGDSAIPKSSTYKWTVQAASS